MVFSKRAAAWFISAALAATATAPASALAETREVNVYSARIEKLIKPALDAFTAETGITVNVHAGNEDALLERLKAEGRHSPADVLMTVDAGNLWLAEKEGLFQSVASATLESNVPAHLRHPEGKWFGLTVRARTLVYSKERLKAGDVAAYADLGDPKWRDRVCLRTSKKVYNMSLVASMIDTLGQEGAQKMVASWVANNPVIESKDTTVLEAILAGRCDVGLVNTYYLGRELAKDPNYGVGLAWADQDGRGTHVNISGAGVTAHAKNRDAAVALLEFLSKPPAQRIFADENLEYPVNPAVPASPQLEKWWGPFKADTVNVSAAGRNQAAAVELMERAGWR